MLCYPTLGQKVRVLLLAAVFPADDRPFAALAVSGQCMQDPALLYTG